MMPPGVPFVHGYVLADDTLADGSVVVPHRPGRACSGAELLTIALVRHRPGRPGEAGSLAVVAASHAA